MGQPKYKVGYPSKVTTAFRRAIETAERSGNLALAIRAAKELMSLLESVPYELGESREEFHDMGIEMRIGFVAGFVVYYGIHEDSKNVFIRSIFWYE